MNVRRFVLPVVALVAVGGGAAAGAVMGVPSLSSAQSTSSSTSTTVATNKPARQFRGGAELAAAAKALGLSTSDLLAKLSDGKTTIADVAQQQKVDLQKVVDAMTAAAHDQIENLVHQPFAKPFARDGHGGPGRAGVAGASGLDAAAKALGMSTSDLETQLRQGKTIAQVAKSKGVDVNKVIDAMVAAAQSKLDDAVHNGRLTQQQADALATRLKDRITQMVNNGFRAGRFAPGIGGFGKHGLGAPAPAAASPSP
jgi:hypothetical protein